MATSRLERLGAGREAEVFAWGEGQALRLARNPDDGPSVEREALALAAAHRAGVPVPAVSVARGLCVAVPPRLPKGALI